MQNTKKRSVLHTQKLNYLTLGFIFCIVFMMPFHSYSAGDYSDSEELRVHYVEQAKKGEIADAIVGLEALKKTYPRSESIHADLITLYTWNENHHNAIELYETNRGFNYPEYALLALAQGYRNMGNPEAALAIVDQLLKTQPENHPYLLKKAQLLVDLEEYVAAQFLLTTLAPYISTSRDFQSVANYLAESEQDWLQILANTSQKSPEISENPEFISLQIKSLKNLAAPFAAAAIGLNYPEAIGKNEKIELLIDQAALFLRWQKTAAESDEEKFYFALKALSLQLQALSFLDKTIPAELLTIRRLQEDMVVSLTDIGQAQAAIHLYANLETEREVATHAQLAYASAHLMEHQPAKAASILQDLLKNSPDNHQAKISLFYAFIESEKFEEAEGLAKQLLVDTPAMTSYTDSTAQYANPQYLDGLILSVLVKLYGGQLSDAQKAMTDIVENASANSWFRQVNGEIAQARSLPRDALGEFHIATLLDPKNNDAMAGRASSYLQLNELSEAKKIINRLSELYPRASSTQRVGEELYWVMRPDLWADFKYTYSDSPEQSGSGVVASAEIISIPINDKLRLSGHSRYAWSELIEGEESLLSYGIGTEYTNKYGNVLLLINNNETSFNEPGGRLRFFFTPDDHWSVTVDGTRFSESTPLRALYYGIYMDKLATDISYRWHESRKISLSLSSGWFSDDNNRLEGGANFRQRLIENPHFDVDGSVALYGSQNSRDNAPYYNPANDFSTKLILNADHTVYRHYTKSFIHSLTGGLGIYAQEGCDSKWVGNILYEHKYGISPVFEGRLGVDVGRNAYDGVPEPYFSLSVMIHGKF